MEKISVIVPVYNSERFLHRCIDSVLVQTYTDFELLLIDDGSTDSSGEICDLYAQKDDRIKVLHKSNGGVSSARNIGLDIASGEWITFIDSDDWVSEQYLEKLSLGFQFDLVISYAKCFGKYGEILQKKYLSKCIDSKDIEILFLEYDLNWQTSPWAKLYRRDLCDNLRFVEGMHIGEDLVFLYTYIMKCRKICVLSDANYNYDMSNEHTLTRSIRILSDELHAYNNINTVLTTIISHFKITNTDVIHKIKCIKSYYINRILNSLYHTCSLTQQERLKHIYSLDIELYLSHYRRKSMKEKLLFFLLKRRLFYTYDFIRMLVFRYRS